MILAGAALLGLTGLGAWQGWMRRPAQRAATAQREWVMVADFEGADSSLAAAMRDLVSAALDESKIGMSVPRDQIRLALQSVGKPANTRVTPEVARLIALRGSVRTLLQGRLGRVGSAHTLAVELDDVDSSKVLFRASETARSDDDLISAAGRLGRKLRSALGENPGAIRGGAGDVLRFAGTNSLRALLLYREASRLSLLGYEREGIATYREALALDPEFASNWVAIGVAFGNLRAADSAEVAFKEALRHSHRLTQNERLVVEAYLAGMRGDFAAVLALRRRSVELRPDSWAARNNLAGDYLDCGHLDEALAEYRRAAELSRFGPNPGLLFNEWLTLLAMGRMDDAQRVTAQMKGMPAQIAPIYNAVVLEQWADVESLAAAIMGESTTPPDNRYEALTCLAAVQSARGAVADARRSLARARAITGTAGSQQHAAEFLAVLLERCSGRPVPSPGQPSAADSTPAGARVRGIQYAASGDTTRARELWRMALLRPDPYGLAGAPDLLEAWIVERRDPRRVVDLLGPTAQTGIHEGRLQEGPARQATRWLVAEAFERLGQPDSAAAAYERVLDHYGNIESAVTARALASSFASQRLVLLYLQLGRVEDARRHWEAFQAAFTRPDPELRTLVDQTRAALAGAEGMTRSARR